ncbi:MAG: hypothetical protein MjAS7_0976 [Metallosphaera javensis (ex Sakai et al. 2022)]|nr:MAG: hypothetical protein MjAS7_0976 [Metallosphaera javensis (ex Sakai et al. 2022)]
MITLSSNSVNLIRRFMLSKEISAIQVTLLIVTGDLNHVQLVIKILFNEKMRDHSFNRINLQDP